MPQVFAGRNEPLDSQTTGVPRDLAPRRSGARRALWRWMRQEPGAAEKVGGAAGFQLLPKLSSLLKLEFVSDSTQLCERREPHFPHHVEAMYLDRTLAYAHIGGNLLVQPALRNLSQYVEFARRQRLESCPESFQTFVLLAPGTIASEPKVNCVEKVLIAERLREELDGAPFHRLHTHRNVTVSSDEDNRELCVRSNEIALEIQSAQPRQSYVEDQAGWTIRRLGSKILGNGGK
jgi:hypothetical protein